MGVQRFREGCVRIKTRAELQAENEELRVGLTATQRKLDAAIRSNAMLEDCIVEMAQVVYA